MKYKFTKKEIENAISNSISLAQVCRILGMTLSGSSYELIHNKIKEHSLNTSHFKGQSWNKGGTNTNSIKKPIEVYLVKNSTCSRTNLKRRLFKEDFKQKQCENCNLSEWFGKPAPLELHHINGVNNDNRIENLQILCANCHAQTDSYCGKNHKNTKIKKKIKKITRGCIDCNIEIYRSSRRCKPCSVTFKRQEYIKSLPDPITLINQIKALGYVKTGKLYNVSDNAIRKWIKTLGLNSKL